MKVLSEAGTREFPRQQERWWGGWVGDEREGHCLGVGREERPSLQCWIGRKWWNRMFAVLCTDSSPFDKTTHIRCALLPSPIHPSPSLALPPGST